MKDFFSTIQKDSVLFWSFWLTIVIVILTSLGIGLSYSNLPPFIPLYNHMPWGYARLGQTYELFIPPLIVVGMSIVNYIFGIKLLGRISLLARFLFITTFILSLFTAIFVARLIFITL